MWVWFKAFEFLSQKSAVEYFLEIFGAKIKIKIFDKKLCVCFFCVVVSIVIPFSINIYTQHQYFKVNFHGQIVR